MTNVFSYEQSLSRAIAQAVSRWVPTAAARVRARVWSCGICGGQSGAGAGFLRLRRFPLPIFIPPIAPQSPSSIIWGLYNRPEVAAVPSGLSPTPLNNKKIPMFTNCQSSINQITNTNPAFSHIKRDSTLNSATYTSATSVPINHLIIILLFEAIQCKQLAALLNKS
jgi:hypothetical protein